MILAAIFSLVAALPFCLILFATMGLPLYMSVVFVAAGIAASAVIRRVAIRRNPLRRLYGFYILGGVAGTVIGLITNGLFALRFRFRMDAAVVSALYGGLGAVLFAIMAAATERTPRTQADPEENARFFQKLQRVANDAEEEASSGTP